MAMSRLAPLALIPLACGAPAHAQLIDPAAIRASIEQLAGATITSGEGGEGNRASIEQLGFDGTAVIGQGGSGNRAEILQNGILVSGVDLPNLAVVAQAGKDGRAGIEQAGTGHLAAIGQDGSTEEAVSAIHQDASFDLAGNLQAGLGASSQIVQGGGLFGIGGHVALVKQVDSSLSLIEQRGSEHVALVDQAGFGNDSDLFQRDLGSEAGDELFLTAGIFQTGDGNQSAVRQEADGAGAFASVIQVGEDNRSDMVQRDAAEALLYQDGTGNMASLLQHAGSAGSLADADQLGDNGRSTIEQGSGAAEARLLQGRGAQDAVSEISQGGGDGNFAEVTQNASGFSHISQTGSLNRAIVFQASGGAFSALRQDGVGNVAEVRQ